MRVFLTTLFMMVVVTLSMGPAQARSIKELALYNGPDRGKILLEGARKEGKLNWYTSLGGKSYKAIAAAFRKKYPKVKLEVYRAGSKAIASKILPEAEAGKVIADVVHSTPPILSLLRDRGVSRPYWSPTHKKWPKEHITAAPGGGAWWITERMSFIGFGYNTKLIPKDRVPKNYEDLLDPYWKGKLTFSQNSTGDRVIGMMLKYKGMEYLDKLKKQDVRLFKLSGSATRDFVIKGEIPSSFCIFRNHALVKINKGAPLDWVPMDVVPTNAGGTSLVKNPRNPHGAMLLIDFIIGEEGQEILQSHYYGLAWKDYPFKQVRPEVGYTTKEYNKVLKKWNRIKRNLGRNIKVKKKKK
jgi:iron(III) transport system substrate-binding protein